MDNAFFDQLSQNSFLRGYLQSTPQSLPTSHLNPTELLLQTQSIKEVQDYVINHYSVERILEALDLKPNVENIKIAEAFLKQGVLPNANDVVLIEKIIQEMSTLAQKDVAIQKAVDLKLVGADLSEPFVKEVVSSAMDLAEIKQGLREIRTAVLRDPYISASTKLELDAVIEKAIKVLDTIKSTQEAFSNLKLNATIAPQIKDIVIKIQSQLADKSNANMVSAQISDYISQIKLILENAAGVELKQDSLLRQTNFLVQKIQEITAVAKNTTTDWQTSLKDISKMWQADLLSFKALVGKLSEKVPLNEADFKAVIANSAQATKGLVVTTKQLLSDISTGTLNDQLNQLPRYIDKAEVLSSNTETPSTANPLLALKEVSYLKDTFVTINEIYAVLRQLASFSDRSDLTDLLTRIRADTMLVNQLESLNKLLYAIHHASSYITFKGLLDKIADLFPDFTKFMKSSHFLADQSPELYQLKNILLEASTEKAGSEASVLQKLKARSTHLLYAPQLVLELENIEKTQISKSNILNSLRKIFEGISRLESRILFQDFFDKKLEQRDIFQSFELKIHPPIEEQSTRIDFLRHQKERDDQESFSGHEDHCSFYIDINLTQTGPIRANIVSSASQNQIHIFFVKEDTKVKAEKNLPELQSELEKIPFPAQIFLHQEDQAVKQNHKKGNNPKTNSFDYLA